MQMGFWLEENWLTFQRNMNLRQLGKIHWKDVISPKKWMSVFRAKRLETEIRFWEVEVFVYYTLEHPRSPMLKE